MIFHVALFLALVGSLALALMLWRWAERVAGVRLLTLFLVGVSVWIAGNELPAWFGAGAQRAGLTMIATVAFTSAVFFHFAVAFTRTQAPRCVFAAYAAGGAASLMAIIFTPGRYVPFAGLDDVAVPNTVGWAASIVWSVLGGAGQLVLLRALLSRTGLARRQVAAVTASSAWGLLCMTGYGIAAVRLPIAPFPLLGLPIYPVFLVYGILRYELLLANAWARRALGWTILVGIAGLVVAAVPLLPVATLLGTQFATAAGVGVAFLVLGGPARRLAERIVYPGGAVTPDDLAAWRADLATATDTGDLARRAGAILSRRLSLPVRVVVGDALAETAEPLLACRRAPDGWHATLASGWESAPPGPRRAAAMLGGVLAEEAQRLERAVSLAQQERERQTQARLAELGALAATVAHDVRNPLNVIVMAVATASPDVRGDVGDQVRRIARLADDLLDYAKPWSFAPAPFDLAALAHSMAARRPGSVEALGPPGLMVLADAGRTEQAIENLLDNACAIAGRVLLEADRSGGMAQIHVCDDGPGIPPDLRDRVFEPFVSRSQGGTGLGLAIVARIAAAQGGAITLNDRPGWTTCFTLSLPLAA